MLRILQTLGLIVVLYTVQSFAILQDPFTFSRGNQSVTLKLLETVKIGRENKAMITLKNIPDKDFIMSGTGLSKRGKDELVHIDERNNEIHEIPINILIFDNFKKGDEWHMVVSGKDENDSIWYHKFSIQINK